MNMYLVSTKDGNIIHTVQVRGGCLSDIEKAQDRLPEWTHSVTIGSCVTVTLGKTTSHLVMNEKGKFSTLGGSLDVNDLLTMIKIAQHFEHERI